MGFMSLFSDYDSFSDSDSDSSLESYIGMTMKEYRRYQAQLAQSDGFEVEPMDNISCIYAHSGPLKFSATDDTDDCVFYSKFAIEEFNKSLHKDTEGELEFDKVVMAVGTSFNYNLTFDAKNLAKGGEKFTYQSDVYIGHVTPADPKVLSFRLKPLPGAVKNWFWKD